MDDDDFRVLTADHEVCAARLDARGAVLGATRQLYRRFGCQPDEIQGRDFFALMRQASLADETVIVMITPDGRSSAPREKILTEMDRRILEGVAAGVPTAKLAPMVELSRGGVEYHVTNLLRKLHAPNRASLVSKAYAEGILAPGVWPPKVVPSFVK